MLSQIARNVASFFIQHGFIQKADEEIYVYGFELLLLELINWSITIVIAVVAKKFLETVFYMVAFIHLRETSGGFHASSQWGCVIISTVVYVLFLGVIRITPVSLYTVLIIIGVFIHMILVFSFAPIAHPNKPFNSLREVQIFRKRSIRNSYMYCCFCVIFILLPWEFFLKLSYCTLLGMLTASLSMMAEYAIQIRNKEKGGNRNEKLEKYSAEKC